MAKDQTPKDKAAADELIGAAKEIDATNQSAKAEPKAEEKIPDADEQKENKVDSNPPAVEVPAKVEPKTTADTQTSFIAPELTAEQKAEEEEKKKKAAFLTKKYGADAILATNGQMTAPFTKISWDRMQTGLDGTKDGWREVVNMPPEVRDMLAKKEAKEMGL